MRRRPRTIISTRPSDEPRHSSALERRARWTLALEALTRPYPMNASTAIPLVLFLGVIVPSYIVIAELMPGRALHAPEVALDRAFPLQPTWALVYGTLYLFLILLPVFVVRQQELIRRTLFAYLTIWLVAYACFLEYPTI